MKDKRYIVGGDPTEPIPDHDEYPDCPVCAGRGEIMHDTDPHTWQPCEACGGNGFINAAPLTLADDTADRSSVGEAPRPEGSPTRAHSGSQVSAAPDWSALDGKRMSELTDSQKRDARELWLRENAGYSPEEKHIRFLLERLDETRRMPTGPMPQRPQSSAGLNRGSAPTVAQCVTDADGGGINLPRQADPDRTELSRRLTEILSLIEGREDIDNSGGPNVFMQIAMVARGEDGP